MSYTRSVVGACALALTTTVLAGAPARAATGLVAAYGFNEGTGAAVADASGTGNNGTTAGTTWATGGRFGRALSFNGTNAAVTVPDSNSLDLVSAMTLEAWVNRSSLGGNWRTVVFKQTGGGMVYALYAHNGAGRPLGQVNIVGEQNALGTSQLPVIVLTGADQQDHEARLMDLGADDYIRKPIDPTRFMARVRATLRRATQWEDRRAKAEALEQGPAD